jgi:hypothetical protein
MHTTTLNPQAPSVSLGTSIQQQVDESIANLMASLPDPKKLSAEQRRGIIGRYTAVLEGNFIYWMTGAFLAVKSDEARAIILDNLHEEVRDSHPAMLRRFALAAHAAPTDADAAAVYRDLTNVRMFVGRLSTVRLVITMAFFEGFIQKFMAYLAGLAVAQGSTEMEYTDVHGVCDVAHTQGLFRALDAEIALSSPDSATNVFEGVQVLGKLIERIVHPDVATNGNHATA